MGRPSYVPITGSVMQWARLEAGYTRTALAEKIRVSPGDIKSWEAEETQPRKTQFRALVAALRRPSALFFSAIPPATTPLRASFRRASDSTGTATAGEFGPLQAARRYQATIEWLASEMREGEPPSHSKQPTPITDSPAKHAETVRQRLGISFREQIYFPSPVVALREWRQAAESMLGVYVFQMQFPAGARGTRGFSLPSESAPVVVLNTAFTEQARTFTLFHEYAHLLLGDAVVCDRWRTSGTKSRHERWAESFAANVLLPSAEFQRLLSSMSVGSEITTTTVRALAARTRVSVRAAALRCIDLGYANWELYEEVVEETKNLDYKAKAKGGTGETAAYRRLREVGPKLPSMLFSARDQDVIGHYDVLKCLDMDTTQARELEGFLASGQA